MTGLGFAVGDDNEGVGVVGAAVLASGSSRAPPIALPLLPLPIAVNDVRGGATGFLAGDKEDAAGDFGRRPADGDTEVALAVPGREAVLESTGDLGRLSTPLELPVVGLTVEARDGTSPLTLLLPPAGAAAGVTAAGAGVFRTVVLASCAGGGGGEGVAGAGFAAAGAATGAGAAAPSTRRCPHLAQNLALALTKGAPHATQLEADIVLLIGCC
jgi:hypothetical protein